MQTFCHFAHHRLRIAPDGLTSMCCIQPRGVLGNILVDGIDAVWNGKTVTEARNAISNGMLPPVCNFQDCPFYREKSRLKERLFPTEHSDGPSEIELDLPIQHCNIGGEHPTKENPACLMCIRNMGFKPQQDRLAEICRLLRPLVGGLKYLHIQGFAEPFWKDKIFHVLDALNIPAASPDIHVSTTSNCTVFTKARQARLLSIPMTTVICSLDAGTPETYKKLRRLDFDTVIKNLFEYSLARSKRQQLLISCNINTINIGEVERMVEIVNDVRADGIIFCPTNGIPDICVTRETADVFRAAQYRILEKARRSNVEVAFAYNLCFDYLPIHHPYFKATDCNHRFANRKALEADRASCQAHNQAQQFPANVSRTQIPWAPGYVVPSNTNPTPFSPR